VRDATVALCEPLEPEDCVGQSMPEASPAKWHLAHTSWFFEEFVLQRATEAYRFHDDRFRYLFNSYYNTVGPMHARPRRGLISRPTVAEVLAYRTRVDEQMQELLGAGELGGPLASVTTLGLHHEQQHQELLLTDIKHLFSCNPLLPAYRPRRALVWRASEALEFLAFPGGTVPIGHDGSGFGFDNEQPRHLQYLQPFRLANRPVSNAEYREFVRAGGYQQPQLWLSDGWAVCQRDGWQRPIYWADSLEQEFTLYGLRELDPHAPVCHVSYYEADAFARWAQARLPTEAEWETAATGLPLEGNFVDSGHLQPEAAWQSETRLLQMFGDVWEWTCSPYVPYPGFRPLDGTLGEYNGKFMVNQLVLRGGSCATPLTHIRPTYRNFFAPESRWQFAGLRLAQDA
jgi:ergothioneine biosynthesis protein EgtB